MPRTELARLIFGIDPIGGGKLFIKGKEIKDSSPVKIVKEGLGMVCEDRKRQGLALNDSVLWNTMAVSLKSFFPKVLISRKKIFEIATDYVKQLRVATPDVYRACKYLSGGNQQKVVLAKWLSAKTDIMILMNLQEELM